MTFLAEWGDRFVPYIPIYVGVFYSPSRISHCRSQIATVVLAAREEIGGVIIGGVLGHALCTGLAVLGGRMIAQKISVRTVTLAGGVVFLIFACTAFFIDPDDV